LLSHTRFFVFAGVVTVTFMFICVPFGAVNVEVSVTTV
jgi:hypothetical protein